MRPCIVQQVRRQDGPDWKEEEEWLDNSEEQKVPLLVVFNKFASTTEVRFYFYKGYMHWRRMAVIARWGTLF